MQLIDGHKIADRIKDEIVKDILEFNKQNRDLEQTKADAPDRPDLAIILINNREDSCIYVDLKQREAQKVGIDTHLYKHAPNITTKEVVDVIKYLNNDPKIDGIFVQLPLLKHLDTDQIIDSIDSQKDVDRFHQKNLQQLKQADDVNSLILPPAFQAINQIFKDIKENFLGKKICVVANSEIFKDSLSLFLEKQGAEVMLSGLKDDKLNKKTQKAEVIVTAVGKAGYLQADMIKKDSILIDMGIVKKENKVYGDINKKNIEKKASYLTPVPGGLGPIIVATALKNTLELYKRRVKK